MHQEPEIDADRFQVLATIYERLGKCPSPATEWRARREMQEDEEIVAIIMGVGVVR